MSACAACSLGLPRRKQEGAERALSSSYTVDSASRPSSILPAPRSPRADPPWEEESCRGPGGDLRLPRWVPQNAGWNSCWLEALPPLPPPPHLHTHLSPESLFLSKLWNHKFFHLGTSRGRSLPFSVSGENTRPLAACWEPAPLFKSILFGMEDVSPARSRVTEA